MDAHSAEPLRSHVLIHDSRSQTGGWLDAGMLQIAVGLRGWRSADGLANQAPYHFRAWASITGAKKVAGAARISASSTCS